MTVQIIPRSGWDARPPKYTNPLAIPTPKLILHHTAGALSPDDDTVSDADLRRVRGVQDWHMDTKNWSDIAYHYLMDVDGNIFEGRGKGVRGGATFGQNGVSHAICVLGHYDRQPVDDDELVPRLVEFIRYGHARGWWGLHLTGHRDYVATSCPGSNLYALIPTINRLVADPGYTPDVPPPPPPLQGKDDQMLPLRHKDGWSSGSRPHKRGDVALLQAMFGLDYGDQQGLYGPKTAEDIGKALGTGPVTEFGHAEARLAAAKGIFVGGGGVSTADVKSAIAAHAKNPDAHHA